MKASSAKLILLQSSMQRIQQKQGGHHRLWLVAFLSLFTFASLAILLVRETPFLQTNFSSNHNSSPSPLPTQVIDALIHYSSSSNATGKISEKELKAIAKALVETFPTNFLIFGLGHESRLWNVLNHGGRTVFLDENEYYIVKMEEIHPNLEAYEVKYTTKVSEMVKLMAAANEQLETDCRPVQNLLFSDCKLGINDLPNHLYDVDWDVILVDGPRGYYPAAPGRMSAIFTAGVLARSKKQMKPTHVFVHDYDRRVEQVYSAEYLCGDNIVATVDQLAHFIVPTMDPNTIAFCPNKATSPPSSP